MDGWTVTKAGTLGCQGGSQAKHDFLNQSVRHRFQDTARKDF